MPIERFNTPDLRISPGFPAASVAPAGRIVFINGQVSRDRDGVLVGAGDHVAQARQAFLNLRHALTAAGATGRDVVQYRITVTGDAQALVGPIMSTVHDIFVDDPIEAPSIFVGATLLGRAEYLIEIEAVASLG